MPRAEPAAVVQQRFQRDPVLVKEALSGGEIGILRHRNHTQMMFRRKRHETRQLLAAWTAPCGPEMQQRHRRSAEIDIHRAAGTVARTCRRLARKREHENGSGNGSAARRHGMNPRIVRTVVLGRLTVTSTFL